MRATYEDNNGLLRFEDTCKLVGPGCPEYYLTEGSKCLMKDLLSLKAPPRKNNYDNDGGYAAEGRILARQEANGLYDL